MKRILTTAALATLATLSSGALAADSYSEAYALHAECTAANYGATDKTGGPADPAAAYAYNKSDKSDTKSDYKGEYKGEYRDGKLVSCNDEQYTAYLETVDPVRVMNAYPTAAGRPVAVTKALDKKAKMPAKDAPKPAPDSAAEKTPAKN